MWTGEGWAHSPGGLRIWALTLRSCDCQSELSEVCLCGSPISRCKVLYSSPVFSFQSASWVILCWTLSWRQQTAYWCSCFYSPGVYDMLFKLCSFITNQTSVWEPQSKDARKYWVAINTSSWTRYSCSQNWQDSGRGVELAGRQQGGWTGLTQDFFIVIIPRYKKIL